MNTKDKRGITPLGVAVRASAEPLEETLYTETDIETRDLSHRVFG